MKSDNNRPAVGVSRDILASYCVDIDEAANGVLLPDWRAIDAGYSGPATYHGAVHGVSYQNAVLQRIQASVSAMNLRSRLIRIGDQLLSGSFRF